MDAGRGTLVGRDVELAEFEAGLTQAAGGRGVLLLVSGEPGIGKTRLLEEAARTATARGFAVAWGRAWEVGGAPAFWPWIEALRSLLPLAGANDEAARELRRLVPELGARGGGSTGGVAVDRFQLFDAVATFLQAAASREPIMVVLDDLHAADPSSLLLTEFVVRQLRTARALVIGSHRDVEARLSRETDASLRRLAREGRELHPARLSEAQVREVVRDAMGRDDDDTARMIHTTSEGNPLFVRELLRLLAAPNRREGVPDGVRAVIRQRLGLLSPATVALLQAAAAVGREFSLPVAAEVAGVTPDGLAEALVEATAADLIDDAGPGRHRFSHMLVAETLVQDIPAPRRARLHARAAESLERRHAGDPAGALAEIAHHWLEAGVDGAGRAVIAAGRAAALAMQRLAFEDAASLDERALGALALAAPGDAVARAELLLALGEAHLRAGNAEQGRAACVEATEVARALGSGDLLARAALTWGSEFVVGLVDVRLVTVLEEALAALPPGDGALRARVMARLAGARQPAPDPEGPVELARAAIAMARRLGDRGVLLRVIHAGMAALMDYAPAEERILLNEEVVALAVAETDRPIALRARLRLAFDQLERADVPAFERAVEAYAALAVQFRQPRYHWPTMMLRSMQALWEGRFAEADRLENDALTMSEADDAALTFSLRRVLALALRTEGSELPAALRRISELLPSSQMFARYFEAWVLARSGDAAKAAERLGELSSEDLASIMKDPNLGAAVGEVLALVGDRARAGLLYSALLPRAGRPVLTTGTGFVLQDLTDRVLLLLATTLGRWPDADRHAEAALALAARLRARPFTAQVRADWAQSLAARGGEPATVRSRALFGDALQAAEELGMPGLARRCREALATSPSPSPSPSPSSVRLALEGDVWTIAGCGEVCRFKDSRGLRMLAQLVAEPGRELSALDLSGPADDAIDDGDAGEVLDRPARDAYQARLRELRVELAEAEQWNDSGRVARLREEEESLTRELTAAVGLGGRARRTGRASERARINVQRRLADALRRIADVAPLLGRHLTQTVRTGTFCAYLPDEPRARR